MSRTNESEWLNEEHRYSWYQPIDWNKFVEFIGGDPNNQIWPGAGSSSSNEPGHTSGHKWQEWWKFYWSWEKQFKNRQIPDNLPEWAKPDKELSDEEIQYWMKHWKSFVSRHWKAWEKDGKPKPSKDTCSKEYNSIIAWGADPENPPPYINQETKAA